MGEVAEAEGIAAQCFQAAVDGFGGSVGRFKVGRLVEYTHTARYDLVWVAGSQVGRIAFGFRNPDNQRRRVRWACTRRSRQVTPSRPKCHC